MIDETGDDLLPGMNYTVIRKSNTEFEIEVQQNRLRPGVYDVVVTNVVGW